MGTRVQMIRRGFCVALRILSEERLYCYVMYGIARKGNSGNCFNFNPAFRVFWIKEVEKKSEMK
jgi:hypothetical protein